MTQSPTASRRTLVSSRGKECSLSSSVAAVRGRRWAHDRSRWIVVAMLWRTASASFAAVETTPPFLPPPGPPHGRGGGGHRGAHASQEQQVHENRLLAMRDRATQLAAVLENATKGPRSRRLHEYLRRSLIDAGKDYEISVCRPRGVAFVHVYKAAGTTAKAFVEAGCPEPRHHFSCCGCDSETSYVYCHTLVDGAKWRNNVTTTFTIVRDPVDRFRSGIFELALRNDPWMLANIEKARRDNISVAEATIDDLLGRSPWFLPDPHIMEQTFFLVDRRHPPWALTYVAKMGPDLMDDFAALGYNLFGMPRSAIDGIPHKRNSHNPSYGKDKIYIHDQPLDDKTIAKIKQYYHVDYAWIDPAAVSNMQPLSSPTLRHRPRRMG